MRPRRSAAVVAGTLLVLATAACGTTRPSGSAGPAEPSMLAGTAAHLVFTLGETRYADVYAGQGGGSDAMTIQVYLSRLDPAVERALRAVAGDGASLVFSRVPHPLAWFEALEKKGENREGNVMVAYGLSGVSISPDAADGRLRIDVGSTKGGLMAALDRAYGAKNIEIQRSADSTLTLVEGP